MKYSILLLAVLLSYVPEVSAQTPPSSGPVNVVVTKNKTGEFQYFLAPINTSGHLTAFTLQDSVRDLDKLVEQAAKLICGNKLKPESVTLSVPVLSATWNVDQLCKK
jgi:hypothetical protein